MRPSQLSPSLALFALLALLLSIPSRALADTYQLYNLGSDQAYFFAGMDDSGLVVIDSTSGCGSGTCYFTYSNGISTGRTATAPSYIADNGTTCTPTTPAGAIIEHAVCNNGYDAWTGYLTAGPPRPSVYAGLSYTDIFPSGGAGAIYSNNLGDIVFDDVFTEQWYEAIDLNTAPIPEPGSLALLATGLLTLATILYSRRRLSLTTNH